MPVRFDSRADFARWQTYVESRPDSHCTDLAEWRLLYRELYGIENHSFLCLERDRTVGAVSLYHIRSPFLGRMLLTCPFFGYGGLYWDGEAVRDALLEQAQATARKLQVDYVELRSRKALSPPFRANTDFSEFNLELKPNPEDTWRDRLSSNVRQNVRRSRRHDLEFRLSAGHGPCYDLLRRTLRAHGTPFHGRRFFELLTAHLGTRVRYSEVWHGSRLVAGGVVIRFRDTILTPYIGSLAGSRPLRPNYFQYWSLIEHYSKEGVARFEMGRSPRGSTHAQFKRKWGCDEVALHYNYLVPGSGRGYRSVSRPSRLQRFATTVWKRLPLAVTTAVGPKLYRYIP